MATFKYNALTSAGRLMKGTIEAGSREEAGELLGQMQLTVNTIEPAKPEKPKTAIGRNEFMLFNQQLASITKAGIPLERGLRELAADVGSKSMRKLIDGVADELEAGVSIEEAFEKRQKHFPPLYGQILKAGVETGRLSEMLTSLNRHLETAMQTRRIIFEAVTYPGVVLVTAIVIATLVFSFVIPQFEPILTEMFEGARLPALTLAFFAGARNWVPFWIGVGVAAAAVAAAAAVLSSFPAGRIFKESIFLKLPIIGRIYRSGLLSRMAEAMAVMVGSGCDMPTCLRLGSTAGASEKLAQESEMLAGQIEQGANILEAGQFCNLIPRLFLYSIQLGAQRNELQDNLYSLGQMYSEQARCWQTRLQSVLLPGMIVFVGAFVLLAVLAIFMPMIQVVSGLSG
ncbi:MAG TPA: type II secretion system F family protein [Sedimentisphaerales bacterium]|nr:type II secretion system F family protein [Sedimentisphaerales bacterium]